MIDAIVTIVLTLVGIYTLLGIVVMILDIKNKYNLTRRVANMENCLLITSKTEAQTRKRVEKLEEWKAMKEE